ncbi:hypothetical protein AAFF_G00273600 [Aldrovandia affinis]|uniref:Uncharacterized protein n=1 Tax=Aldrovandia affinis TaxID=143900 RepID=A0AAD7WSL3_9TELE|nr:hypothetical protein AAFF_G00273600 [Aldrovandia affinis]
MSRLKIAGGSGTTSVCGGAFRTTPLRQTDGRIVPADRVLPSRPAHGGAARLHERPGVFATARTPPPVTTLVLLSRSLTHTTPANKSPGSLSCRAVATV